MRIALLARRWGAPAGGPDGMAVAVAYLAHTLCELGHDVTAYTAEEPPPWGHARLTFRQRPGLSAPDDFGADLVITTISAVWRRTAAAADKAGARGRLVYWHHHGGPPEALGCTIAAPPAVVVPREWSRAVVLPPSSWAADAGGAVIGSEVLVPGASPAKGGHVALAAARLLPGLRFYVLAGRSSGADRRAWESVPGVEVATGRVPTAAFLDRARLVLSPTRFEVHPLTLVEAAARGIPIVCSDLPSTRAAAGEGALYVPVAAPASEWAAAVRRALERPLPRVRARAYREVVAEAIDALTPTSVAAFPTSNEGGKQATAPAIVCSLSRSKPRIAILADVRTWAWARKARALVEHLGSDFALEVAYLYGRPHPDPVPAGADLYHTFEVFQASRLPDRDRLPYVTGMTAHVWQTWERQHGPGTVRRWAEGALAFHANSILLRDEMRQLLGRPIAYCPNGVDHEFFRRVRRRKVSDRLVVGWVGKPTERKGVHIVREACVRAGVELRTVERRHTNALPPEGMREFYQDLHVLCVASDMDGTPNPALEAAACGVAIVSNHIGNMPELLASGAGGVLVGASSLPPRQPTADEIAAVFRTLTPAAAASVGEAARAEIERAWTWRDLSRNYAAMWWAALDAKERRQAA